MKMLYAGINGLPEDYLFNCTRNQSCQRPYYIPIPSLFELQLYFDFQFGKPTAYVINIITCDGEVIPLTWCSYVIGQHTDDTWYGIFTQPEQSDSIGYFYISAEFVFEGYTYKYYSNQIKIEECHSLVEISSCYNDTDNQQYAFDCNGVYYQYHAGTGIAAGNPLLRYNHKAFVRRGQVIESKNKLSFTLFNSRTAYKNSVTKEFLFEFELVPAFYKDILLAVFNRGNILINNIPYTLIESQDIGITDNDSKLWKMDISLTEICKQYFSCTPTVCETPDCGTPVIESCCDPVVTDAIVVTPDACCDPTVIDATAEEGTAPEISATEFGVIIADTDITSVQKASLAKNGYGVQWARTAIILTDFTGVSKPVDENYKIGLKTIVNLNYKRVERDSSSNRITNTFPSDMTLYEAKLRAVLDKYYKKIDIAVIENEPTNDLYFGTSPISGYITMLERAITVCHEYGVLIADGCTHVPLINGVAAGGALTANETQVRDLIIAYASMDLDYVNMHTKGTGSVYTPAGAILSAADYLRAETGKPVISNEYSISTNSTSLIESILDKMVAAGVQIVVAYDGSSDEGGYSYHVPGTITLNSLGIAFRDKIAILV
jgi:hypothetical protein